MATKYDVFLSHSSEDKEVVRDIAERLQADGLAVWFDEWRIKPGDSIPEKVDEGLENSRVLVHCMSTNALKSGWVTREYQTQAFKDPANESLAYIPLRLDDAPIKRSLAQFLYIDWRLERNDSSIYPKLLKACSGTNSAATVDAFSDGRRRSSNVKVAHPRKAASDELAEGYQIHGRYEVKGTLGRGGMGIVYLVEDRTFGGECALKVIHPNILREQGARKRFKREIDSLMTLGEKRYAGIVRIFERGEDSDLGSLYFTMEYIEGELLRDRMDREPMTVEESVMYTQELLNALEFAHEHLVHRDLTPNNIMLRQDGGLVLLDFGLAKLKANGQAGLSLTGAAGTAYYMAPEQIRGSHEPTACADIYAVGVMLYEMLTENLPVGFLRAPSGENSAVSASLDKVVLKCLERKPEERYPDAAALRDAIEEALAAPDVALPPPAPRQTGGPSVSATVSVISASKPVAPEPAAGMERVFELGKGVSMDFIWIPPGEFMMGSPKGIGDDDEHPQHLVKITSGFWLGKYLVTQRQWTGLMGHNPSRFSGEDLPVERLLWKDCKDFLKRLRERGADGIYRLPTEAEWEYACRAGTGTFYSFGDDEYILSRFGWFDENSGHETHPVGGKLPNPWGLHDMHGNVSEWCEDYYDENFYAASPTADPRGPGYGRRRVLRGGNFHVDADGCRSAARNFDSLDLGFYDIGFRVVRTS